MLLYRGLESVPAGFGPSAVTIGKFDGLHTGHRAIIERLEQESAAAGLTSVVATFDRNPLIVFAPEKWPRPLATLEQKFERLEDVGVDVAVIINFNAAFARLEPAEFVDQILVGILDARILIVGADFRFGAGAAGNVDELTRLGAERGIRVIALSDVTTDGGTGAATRRASSTWIRELLAEGDVEHAARLLGRPHSIRSVVVHGLKRGRALGWPTANLHPAIEGFVPADGVYAAWALVDGHRYPAAVSIGDNPTFEGVPEKQVEAYLLDEDLDLYGRTLELDFVQRLRGMAAFAGIEPLKAQIAADVDDTRRVLLG